jgi:hypothetical protein
VLAQNRNVPTPRKVEMSPRRISGWLIRLGAQAKASPWMIRWWNVGLGFFRRLGRSQFVEFESQLLARHDFGLARLLMIDGVGQRFSFILNRNLTLAIFAHDHLRIP